MKTFSYYIVYPFALLVGLLPYKMQFVVSDIVRWVLYKVIRYRVAVVRDNLRRSFPEKSVEQRLQIERNYYKHLADVFLETISLISVSRKNIRKRMTFLNADQIEDATQGTTWLAAMAHYGSWEYTVSYGLESCKDGILAVYRPLADRGFDKLYRRMRSRFGATPVPMKEITKRIILAKKENKQYAVALISDQNPPLYEHQYWVDFLGQKTLFFGGLEKFAMKYNLPVAFLHVDKLKRGYYNAWFELIYNGTDELPDGEITRRYASHLEAMIRRRPELWMWSHRRWKHNYEELKKRTKQPDLTTPIP